MQVRGSQLADAAGKKYPTGASASSTGKIFTQGTAPSGVGEGAGDIWLPSISGTGAAPALRQMAVGPQNGTCTTTTLTMPVGAPTDGNLLLAFTKTVGGRTVTPATGSWTQLYHAGPADSTDLYCHYRTASSEGTTFQFDFSGTTEYNSTILVEVSNAAGGIDTHSTSSTGWQIPAITATNFPNLVFFQLGQNNGKATYPLPQVDDYKGGPTPWVSVFQQAQDYHFHGLWWRVATAATLPDDTYVRGGGATNIVRATVSIAN